ncbi:hotdog fold thioesterase [Cohnella sp. CFH 77786]|uniref:PaaI family thioesterase n=1 Tax=Cohnella sp. CFH 77786 TaxID=2662265 RepID=UPI001C60BE4F|nr:PaaI family thioesterase [Cohnella sp. CFH 77786]MBW5448280.1 hotdog fold thioesterase [Cohnella sp. CFH 77786]
MDQENPKQALSAQVERLKEKAEHSFWGFLGCELEALDEKRVTVSLDVRPHHLNLIGILHGGVHATLMDSAMGLVAMIARPQESVVTTNLNLHYVAPTGVGRITVTAELLHMSRKMINTQASARREDGELLAFGTGTFRVIDRPV